MYIHIKSAQIPKTGRYNGYDYASEKAASPFDG
jgi:hypothetical protein